MTSYAAFQWAGPDELETAVDYFCGMVETINPLAEITIKDTKRDGSIVGKLVFVEGMRPREVEHLKVVAIHMANREMLDGKSSVERRN